jgi:hypothetical protein
MLNVSIVYLGFSKGAWIMEIGEITTTPENLKAQSWRRGPRVKGPLRLKIEALQVGQSFSIFLKEGDSRSAIRDRIASARKQVSMQTGKKFSVNAVGDSEFVISRNY